MIAQVINLENEAGFSSLSSRRINVKGARPRRCQTDAAIDEGCPALEQPFNNVSHHIQSHVH